MFLFFLKQFSFELRANGRDAAFWTLPSHIQLLQGFCFELELSPIRSQKFMLEIVFFAILA
jgi:hypothetical protein